MTLSAPFQALRPYVSNIYIERERDQVHVAPPQVPVRPMLPVPWAMGIPPRGPGSLEAIYLIQEDILNWGGSVLGILYTDEGSIHTSESPDRGPLLSETRNYGHRV